MEETPSCVEIFYNLQNESRPLRADQMARQILMIIFLRVDMQYQCAFFYIRAHYLPNICYVFVKIIL